MVQQKLKKQLNLDNIDSRLTQYIKAPEQSQPHIKENRSNSLDNIPNTEDKVQEQKEKYKVLQQKNADYLKKLSE